MAFDKDAKIREKSMTFIPNTWVKETSDNTYTLYHMDKEAHLSLQLPEGVYTWGGEDMLQSWDGKDTFQFFTDMEIDFLTTMVRSMIEISEVTPPPDEIDVCEEMLGGSGMGIRMLGVVKMIVKTGYQHIRIVPGDLKPSYITNGRMVDVWEPDFRYGIRI